MSPKTSAQVLVIPSGPLEQGLQTVVFRRKGLLAVLRAHTVPGGAGPVCPLDTLGHTVHCLIHQCVRGRDSLALRTLPARE